MGFFRLFLKPGLDLDPEKQGSWKTWIKYGIKKYMSFESYVKKSRAQCNLLFKSSQISKLNLSGK